MEIDDYILGDSLGKGAFRETFLGTKKGSTMKYAIKKFNKTQHGESLRYIEQGIEILKNCNHPIIIKLCEVKEKGDYLYIIEEYCNGGQLETFLEEYQKEKKAPLSEEIVQYIMKQVIEANKYLNGKDIMHRHFTCENLLLNYEDEKSRENKDIMKSTIKIVGFDFARYLKEGDLAKTILGSPLYMSPYILRGLNMGKKDPNIGYGKKEDIWSLGSICYRLLTGNTLFDSRDMDELVLSVQKGDYYLPANLSKEAVSFLNCMLQYNSEERLSAEQLANHNFLKKNVSEFKKIDINELKNVKIIYQPSIIINTKDNKSIWENFGKGTDE